MGITIVALGNTDPIAPDGGQNKIKVSDSNVEQLLNDSIKELKKMNLHMSLMTDTNVTNLDVE